MKKRLSNSLIVVVLIIPIVGSIGCQSGWKFSNPFAKTPRASAAQTPSELEDIDDLDDLTPPPENYTKRDDRNESASLAQKGEYKDDSATSATTSKAEENALAQSEQAASIEAPLSETKAESEKRGLAGSSVTNALADATAIGSATAPTADVQLAANAQAPSVPTAQNAPVSTTVPTSAIQPDAALLANQAPAAAQAASNAASAFPVDPSLTAQSSFPTAPGEFPAATTGFPEPQTDFAANSPFPAPQADVATSSPFPTAQTDLAANSPFPTAPADPLANDVYSTPSTNAPNATNVALNYDPYANAPNQATTQTAQDSDPYSNVIYDRQTTSGGFAPGSVGLY